MNMQKFPMIPCMHATMQRPMLAIPRNKEVTMSMEWGPEGDSQPHLVLSMSFCLYLFFFAIGHT